MEILLNSTTQIQQADKEVIVNTELNVPQDIDISNIYDSSGCIRLTVWEEYINKLEEDTSYHFSGVTVRTFKGKIFLSSSKDLFAFKKIDDIGNIEYPEDQGCRKVIITGQAKLNSEYILIKYVGGR